MISFELVRKSLAKAGIKFWKLIHIINSKNKIKYGLTELGRHGSCLTLN